MNNSLLEQIKERRLALQLKQHDMHMRVGISRQQYQRLESQGNPRLDTLTLVAQGLNSELMLIPKEKREAVLRVLAGEGDVSSKDVDPMVQAKLAQYPHYTKEELQSVIDDPWNGFWGKLLEPLDKKP